MSTPARRVADLELRIFDIGGSSPTDTFAGDDIVGDVDLEAGVGQTVGAAQALLKGTDLPIDEIAMGRRIEIHAAVDGGSLERIGTVRIGDYEIALGPGDGPDEISLGLENFVFSILRDRRFTGRLRDEPLDEAIDRMVSAEASELSTSISLPDPPDVDETFEATPLLAAISDIVTEDALIGADDQTLVVDPIPDSVSDSLDESDLLPATKRVSGGPITRVRVDGGDLRVPIPAAAQADTEDTLALLDDTDEPVRVELHLTPVQHAELASLDLATINDNADGTLICRLHPDDGGTPLAPSDPDQAISTRRLDTTFVAEDGRTTIEWPEHTLKTDPWLIVTQRAEGSPPTALELRGTTDSSGTFRPSATKITTPKPVVLRKEDETASTEIGRRDGRIQRDSIASFDEAESAADRFLAKRATPREEISAGANSTTAHDLSILDAVDLSQPALWSGTRSFVVIEKQQTISSTLLTTTLTFAQPPGFDL